ncbi:MAG: hypothetical protein KJ749_01520 [Planctomycetes bacterium]|nr:hypothetical protein [Planctomycetota bacterium]
MISVSSLAFVCGFSTVMGGLHGLRHRPRYGYALCWFGIGVVNALNLLLSLTWEATHG